MGNFIHKIQVDLSGYLFSKMRYLGYSINKSFFSSYMYCSLRIKKISIGNKCTFYGKTYFSRHPKSKILIGNHCIFDSAKYHNLIGINKNCILSTLTEFAELSIGNSTGFSGVRIGCAEKISIGKDCLIGANVLITDTDWHPLDPLRRKESAFKSTEFSRPVTVGNNVFIGANSIILKGSIIGDNSVIGAGSVVSGTIPPNVIAAGNPCKILKKLND